MYMAEVKSLEAILHPYCLQCILICSIILNSTSFFLNAGVSHQIDCHLINGTSSTVRKTPSMPWTEKDSNCWGHSQDSQVFNLYFQSWIPASNCGTAGKAPFNFC